jgi:hypothetical protein
MVRRPDCGLRLGLLLVGPDNHDHVTAVELRLGLNEAKLFDVDRQLLQQPGAEFRPRLLAPPEHDRHLDLVALPQEPLDMPPLGAVVVRVDLRPDLDLLDDRLGLVLARLPRLEGRLVLELAVIHQFADRRPRSRRDLDEVEVGLLSQPKRLGYRDDADLLARWADQPHFGHPDAIVDSRFGADVTSCITFASDAGLIPASGISSCSPRKQEAPHERACGATTDTTSATPALARATPAMRRPDTGRRLRAVRERPAMTGRPEGRPAHQQPTASRRGTPPTDQTAASRDAAGSRLRLPGLLPASGTVLVGAPQTLRSGVRLR